MPTYDSGSTGMVGTAGVTILNADGTAHTARATAGISELVAGTGVLYVAHPAIGTPLIFVWDKGVGTLGASETTTGVYDTLGFIEYTEPGEGVTLAEAVLDVKEKTDNLPASPAAVGSAMTLTAAYDAAKSAASQTSVNAIPTTPLLAEDYTAPDNAGIAAAKAAAEAAQVAAAVGYIDGDTLITQASLDTDGAAIGRTTAGATVTAYLAADTGRATPKRQATADEDGDWSLYLTGGSTYTLVFAKSGYSEATAEVTVA